MIPSRSIGPRTLLKNWNHSATAIFWRSAIRCTIFSVTCRLRWRTLGLVHSALFFSLSCTRWYHENPPFVHWLELHGGPNMQLT